jgi:acyl-CoA reductase-like NAD-dependent aldehyde dehydrogenase
MWSSDTHLNRVCAAATDGRMSNVRFIQSQLKAFYESILASREGILEAIKSNPLITSTEAEVEFSLAIAAVKEHYDEINFDQAIADEYKVAKGEGNPSRRVGHGVVVLRPTTHTRFYAIVSAVACAIASGNTFIVEVSLNSSHL